MARPTAIFLAPCALLLAVMSANGATRSVTDLSSNNLIITEYLANPVGVSDADGEYFEIFNATQDRISLDGLIVRDDGSNSFTVSTLALEPWSFAVFSSSDGTSLGLTPAYVYGAGMTLTNGDDEIGLYRPDDTLIHKLAYTDGDAFGAGVAHELTLLNGATPALTFGPTVGTDFVAGTLALPLDNFGSPGTAGNTTVQIPAVPLPASVWMLGSALSMLSWVRKRVPARRNSTGDRHAQYPGLFGPLLRYAADRRGPGDRRAGHRSGAGSRLGLARGQGRIRS